MPESKLQDVKSTLGNNITIALFLVVTVWGILITTVIQSQLKKILFKEDLAHDVIENINRQFVFLSTGVTILGIIAVLGVTFVFSKKITKAIKQLTNGVMKVAAGDLDTKLNITSQDEIGQLAHSFNKMTEDLKNSTTSIVNLNKEIAWREQGEKKIEKQNKFLNSVLESISHPFYVIDTETHKILLGNNATYNGSAIENITCHQLIYHKATPCDGQENTCPVEVVKKTGKPTVVEHIHYDENNLQKNIEVHAYPLFNDDGQVESMIEYSLDITERKQTEKAMEQLNNKLKESNGELKNFVYIASHDLREPLRKITAFGNILQDSLENQISDDDKENLHFMIDGSHRMMQMIDGLLAYSRLNTQAHPTKCIDLNQIVQQIKELELAILLSEKNVVLDIPQPLPCIMVDPVKIRQLFQNLIANGIKYQPKDNPTPKITINSKSTSDGMVRIEVTDNGIGIKPEYIDSVFVMFKRLHSRTQYEGTGIGLAVCKKIVTLHGGEIGVESEYGKGSTFWFTIPMTKKSAS